mgnify:CR=1 FL=1
MSQHPNYQTQDPNQNQNDQDENPKPAPQYDVHHIQQHYREFFTSFEVLRSEPYEAEFTFTGLQNEERWVHVLLNSECYEVIGDAHSKLFFHFQ